ncbi:uncharacterized protein LOC134451973 [Engraulis encrasicolus]|uniref:uncharacterized protein LOC134451973 n=1 Tax=Engraulis encrasicolus TaxID=184585 RepID=UPI002FD57987
MRSSLLCLALLFASTCEMDVTEYDYHDYPSITEQLITNDAISSEPTTITTITTITTTLLPTTTTTVPTTTTTVPTTKKAAEPKVTCPTCVTCVQAIVGDNSMLVILVLAVACLFLLITTMALACKVCSLKRQQGEYQPCHAADDDESHLANGKSTKTDTGGNNEDNAVMMTEVFSENETTATEEKGSKQEEDGASTASSQNSSEGKDGSDESPSGAAVNDDQANTDAMEAPKDPAVSETANVSDVSGSGAAGEPASGSTEETPANVEG